MRETAPQNKLAAPNRSVSHRSTHFVFSLSPQLSTLIFLRDFLHLARRGVERGPLVLHLRRGAQSFRTVSARTGRRSDHCAFSRLLRGSHRARIGGHAFPLVSAECAAGKRRSDSATARPPRAGGDPAFHPTGHGNASPGHAGIRAMARNFHGAESFLLDRRSRRFFIGAREKQGVKE